MKATPETAQQKKAEDKSTREEKSEVERTVRIEASLSIEYTKNWYYEVVWGTEKEFRWMGWKWGAGRDLLSENIFLRYSEVRKGEKKKKRKA